MWYEQEMWYAELHKAKLKFDVCKKMVLSYKT